VFDLRAGARLLASLPFGAGPSMLRFHPKFSATLLVAGSQGVFVLADASGASYNRTYQARPSAGLAAGRCRVVSSLMHARPS